MENDRDTTDRAVPKNQIVAYVATALFGVGAFLLGLIAAVEQPRVRQQNAASSVEIATSTTSSNVGISSRPAAPSTDTDEKLKDAEIERLNGELEDVRGELARVRARARHAEEEAADTISTLQRSFAERNGPKQNSEPPASSDRPDTRERSSSDAQIEELAAELHRMAEAQVALREKLERAQDDKAKAEQHAADLRAALAERNREGLGEGVAAGQSLSLTRAAPAPVAEAVPVTDRDRLQAGIKAYRSGNYRDAYELWLPLAKDGVARARFHIGALYYEGRGISRDLVAAYAWLDAAACAGVQDAGQLLAHLEQRMEAEQIVLAQKRISEEHMRGAAKC